MTPPSSRTKDRWYVAIQLLLFATYLFPVDVLTFSVQRLVFWLGVPLLASGLALALAAVWQLRRHLSPFSTPVSGGVLLTTGVFGWMRHPIYSGPLLFFLGLSLVSGSGFRLLLTGGLLLLFYYKSRYEERLLGERFAEYGAYRERVGRFLL